MFQIAAKIKNQHVNNTSKAIMFTNGKCQKWKNDRTIHAQIKQLVTCRKRYILESIKKLLS
jgi:hypothetical protein